MTKDRNIGAALLVVTSAVDASLGIIRMRPWSDLNHSLLLFALWSCGRSVSIAQALRQIRQIHKAYPGRHSWTPNNSLYFISTFSGSPNHWSNGSVTDVALLKFRASAALNKADSQRKIINLLPYCPQSVRG